MWQLFVGEYWKPPLAIESGGRWRGEWWRRWGEEEGVMSANPYFTFKAGTVLSVTGNIHGAQRYNYRGKI